MNDQLRSESRARLAAIETRWLEIQSHLATSRERDALEAICDLRGQLNVLFASLLAGHLHELAPEDEPREIETLIRQLLNVP